MHFRYFPTLRVIGEYRLQCHECHAHVVHPCHPACTHPRHEQSPEGDACAFLRVWSLFAGSSRLDTVRDAM